MEFKIKNLLLESINIQVSIQLVLNITVSRQYVYAAVREVNDFIFLKNDRFVMKTMTKNQKRNDRF